MFDALPRVVPCRRTILPAAARYDMVSYHMLSDEMILKDKYGKE